MNNNTLQIKIKQRLNKLDSNDYDNVKDWQIVEAFNKAQIEWCRRQLRGTNSRQEGDEQSKRRIDDLEILIVEAPLTGADVTYNDTFGYFLSNNFEAIYDNSFLEFKRIRCNALQQTPPGVEIIRIPTYLVHKTGPDDPEYTGTDPAGWNAENATNPNMSTSEVGLFIDNLNNWSVWTESGTIPTPYLQYELGFDENGYGPIIRYDEEERTTPGTFAPGMDKEKCCEGKRTMTVYLSEVGNADIILRDPLKNPNWEWAETYCTIRDHEIRIWRKDFFIVDPYLIYYRKPRRIQIANSVDPYTGVTSAVDVECEFKDDIVENILDDTISIIAGDISDANNLMRGQQQSEKNN